MASAEWRLETCTFPQISPTLSSLICSFLESAIVSLSSPPAASRESISTALLPEQCCLGRGDSRRMARPLT